MNTLNEFLERELSLLCRKSIFLRLLEWREHRFPRKWGVLNIIADDKVALLESSPLGMFIYNLRILFLIGGIIFFFILTLLNLVYLDTSNEQVNITLYFLGTVLLLAIIIAVKLNRDLRRNLLEEKQEFARLYTIFERYFLIDIILILSATITGKYILRISVESLIFLAVANLFVYSIYVVGHKSGNNLQASFINSLILPVIAVPAFIIWFVILTFDTNAPSVPQLFYVLLIWGAMLASVWVSIISVSTISYLRKKELTFSEKRMDALVSLVASIAQPLVRGESNSSNIVSNGVTSLLRNICSLQNVYEYRAIRMWELVKAIEEDTSKNVYDDLALLASYSKDARFQFPQINAQNLHTTIHPIPGSYTIFVVVPIRHENLQIGFIELYYYQETLFTQQEAEFLRSLSEIVYFGYQHLKAKQEMLAITDVDNILRCNTLDEAFQNATIQLHKYLSAQGSMLLLRVKNTDELQIVASEGFRQEYIRRNKYAIGRGLTGLCAEKGELILVNDVENSIDKFDQELLSNVAKGLGSKVLAWMAIPIGEKNDVLGVVKVVNKKPGAGKWFTEYDQKLAAELAQKLKVVLDKFIHLENIREAEQRALERAEAADIEKKNAEKLARERHQDLITLSHQLQSPLHASIGRISLILEDNRLFSSLRRRLEFCNALLFDSQDLIFGVLIATSRESGQKIFVSYDKVSAQDTTKAIYERMRKTGNRPDLKFEYTEDENFPLLTIDKRILSSVLYTLIHNATKYADLGSIVKLQCGFEWSLLEKRVKYPAIKVKSIGPPITFSEREKIFEKFYRGQSVRKTGRYKEPGIGLGLWVARNLMRATGGDITLEFSNENSRFSIFVIHFSGEHNDK